LKWGATPQQVALAFPGANCESKQTRSFDWRCTVRNEHVNKVPVVITITGHTTGKVVGMSAYSLAFKSDAVRPIVRRSKPATGSRVASGNSTSVPGRDSWSAYGMAMELC